MCLAVTESVLASLRVDLELEIVAKVGRVHQLVIFVELEIVIRRQRLADLVMACWPRQSVKRQLPS